MCALIVAPFHFDPFLLPLHCFFFISFISPNSIFSLSVSLLKTGYQLTTSVHFPFRRSLSSYFFPILVSFLSFFYSNRPCFVPFLSANSVIFSVFRRFVFLFFRVYNRSFHVKKYTKPKINNSNQSQFSLLLPSETLVPILVIVFLLTCSVRHPFFFSSTPPSVFELFFPPIFPFFETDIVRDIVGF